MTVQKKNILVIEDSEQYMDMICSKLSNITDINVYKAKDSAQAYKYARRKYKRIYNGYNS